MWTEFKKLLQFKELLVSMVQRELKVRYKNSVLGFLWSLLNPLFVVVIMTYVFKVLQGNPTPNFSAYILAAYLPYMFFQMAIMDATSSVIMSLQLVKKIYFPREILPIASIISNFIHFLLAMCVFFVYLAVIYLMHPQVPVFQWTTVYLPILLAIQFCLALGLGLLLSAVNTFYEDVKYIVQVVLMMLFFLSPIMYFSEVTYYPPRGSKLHYELYHGLNPIATLSTAYRKILLAPQAPVNGHPALPID